MYPEGHDKRIEQDSQRVNEPSAPSEKKKKKHKTVVESSEPVNDPNSISVSDAETESGNEHNNDNANNNDKYKNANSDQEEIEEEPENMLKIKSTLKKILLLRNMVMKENLGSKNQCLFLLRNLKQKRKNIIINFVIG